MAVEDFQRPGEAPWSVNEIQYADIVRSRVEGDTRLFYLLASASFVETASDLYTQNLVELFGGDRQAVEWLQQRWEPEELQHGVALKRYVQAAWPDFDWDGTYRSFFPEFSRSCSMETLEPSRALELVARCVVEMGTSSFYGMLAASSCEPVLTMLASRIRADEVRHYKHFYRYFLKYSEREQPGRAAVLKTLLKRAAAVQSEEAIISFKHLYLARNPGSEFRKRDYDLYCTSVRRLARRHFPRKMAVKMMMKPLRLGVLAERFVRALAKCLCGFLLWQPGREGLSR